MDEESLDIVWPEVWTQRYPEPFIPQDTLEKANVFADTERQPGFHAAPTRRITGH